MPVLDSTAGGAYAREHALDNAANVRAATSRHAMGVGIPTVFQ
jgi:hypothetical protein